MVSDTILQTRKILENDLWLFARAINPHYKYGEIHERVFRWLDDDGDARRKLALLPRGHLKSHCAAVWSVREITRNPWTSIVYLSAGEELAKAQIYSIKLMMLSKNYQHLWPEMINKNESQRELWNAFGFNVDHPERRERGTRDQTMLVRTVKSNAIGLHCDHVVFDDVVIPQFAYTETGRREVQRAIAQYSSILNPGGSIKAVGTRYHMKDAYIGWIEGVERIWDEERREFVGERLQWDVLEEKVEDKGDGTGTFLWPREYVSKDNIAYGYDVQELERIKAGYVANGENAQFWAQYYHETNSAEDNRVGSDHFSYYERKFVEVHNGRCSILTGGTKKRLNVFAAMDVAWTTKEKSDYTAIVVIGVDSDGYIYILDMDQFKTSMFSEYYDRVQNLQMQWGFRSIRVETNAGGKFVKQELETLVRRNGGSLVVDGKHVTGHDGKKYERHAAITEPRYHNKTILHYKGGYTSLLEEQVMLERPPHDDLLDALTAAIEISKPPIELSDDTNIIQFTRDSRFGGRRGR